MSSQRTPTRSIPRAAISLSPPSTSSNSRGRASQRLKNALHLNNLFAPSSFSKQPKLYRAQHDTSGRPLLSPNAPQRDLVQAIVADPEQWEKLQRAMRQQRQFCTSMGLIQDLHGLLQDRLQEMEEQDVYLASSSSDESSVGLWWTAFQSRSDTLCMLHDSHRARTTHVRPFNEWNTYLHAYLIIAHKTKVHLWKKNTHTTTYSIQLSDSERQTIRCPRHSAFYSSDSRKIK